MSEAVTESKSDAMLTALAMVRAMLDDKPEQAQWLWESSNDRASLMNAMTVQYAQLVQQLARMLGQPTDALLDRGVQYVVQQSS